MYEKCHPVRDVDFRREWSLANPRCLACGRTSDGTPSGHLDTHHICKFRRSDEATNFARFCALCHMAAEGLRSVRGGEVQPLLSLENVLWLKSRLQPLEYDGVRLKQLYGRFLPELEEPDLWYRLATLQNNPLVVW